ncbi:MAG TPA: 1,4-dihydroxy-2-naphthoate polyprenyltransferase [Candidatus Omnitrophota bacterium]|nr:1,4-dihydroxy-2-naphthoate polyprenyltransferase [Candidatus Omnitrophota bacterium]
MDPWILASRPKTLPAAIAPVMIGTAMAFGDGVAHFPSALAALFAALCIQIATNFTNDYCDFKKGADTSGRLGPVRATQAGLASPRAMISAAILVFLLAALACIYLVFRGGSAIAIIGVVSVLSGIFYTAGPRPLAYMGLGELFVFIFFGPVAVAGTYFVQALEINTAVVAAGFGTGFLSCAILAVNNLRDIDGDAKAGKMTLAVRFGKAFAAREYLFCIIAASLTPFAVNLITKDHDAIAAASLVGFMAIGAVQTVFTGQGAVLNKILTRTGVLLLVYSILFSAGWVLCSR